MPKAKSKIPFVYKILFSLLLTTMAIAIFWYYLQYKLEKKSEQTFYKAFGISIPNNYKLHGIDVSKYQSYIYWTSVKKMKIDSIAIDFAFIKATEGNNITDPMFKRNWQLSKQNNITHGAYHFFIATKDGKQQAKNFINNVVLQKGDLPPVLDIEENYDVSKAIFIRRIKDCLNAMQQYYGVKPIIYSYANFYANYLADDFEDYPVWVAHYTDDNEPNIDNNWTFWQHSESGRVNGITEKVDFDVFYGDSLAFTKILLK
jgi:lysozyme